MIHILKVQFTGSYCYLCAQSECVKKKLGTKRGQKKEKELLIDIDHHVLVEHNKVNHEQCCI